jgi:tubulin--tyrosine ligase-like protein 12
MSICSGEWNVWIVKPWNMARSIDMHISDDVDFIVRLTDAGPKVRAPTD